MAHYAIVVDLDRCIGCHGCEIACKNENNIALGEYWNKVVERGPFGEYPDLEMYFLPTMCQQCQDAPCVNVCPTGASYRDADGMVLVDKEKCIGCKYCMMACPYGVRSWNAAESVVEKCTLCAHLSKNGELPMCVLGRRPVLRRYRRPLVRCVEGSCRGRSRQHPHPARCGEPSGDALHSVAETRRLEGR